MKIGSVLSDEEAAPAGAPAQTQQTPLPHCQCSAKGPEPALLDASDVAGMLKCSARTVYRLADSGRMPAPVHLGSLVRWSRMVLDEWVAEGCPSCKERPLRGAR